MTDAASVCVRAVYACVHVFSTPNSLLVKSAFTNRVLKDLTNKHTHTHTYASANKLFHWSCLEVHSCLAQVHRLHPCLHMCVWIAFDGADVQLLGLRVNH